MLAPDKGNLAHVYREFHRMQEIAQQVEPAMNHAVTATSRMEAEIGEGAHAAWYLVNAYPGDDVRAMRWLARRKFGVFRPMEQRTKAHREGQRIGGMEPVFPGWLFVLCWDINKLRGRILATPGVLTILSDPVTLAPIPIPDEFVFKMRELAWVFEERLTHTAQESDRQQQRKQPRRPDKRERKALDRLLKEMKARGFDWDEDTWADVNRLEPHERIALLTRTLSPSVMVAAPPGNGG